MTQNYRTITIRPLNGPAINLIEYNLDTRDLPEMTAESAKAHRDFLIANGALKPYVSDESDFGFERPTLYSDAVQRLRDRLIKSGNLTVGDATRSYVREADGRRYYYEADLSLPTPIQLDEEDDAQE